MKKILLILSVVFVLIISSVLVSAQSDNKPGLNGPEMNQPQQAVNQQGENSQAENQPDAAKESREAMKPTLNQTRNQTGSPLDGLNNALTNVKNEKAREMLQRNIDRWMEKNQERFNNMENVEVEVDEETGNAEIKAKEEVKYLGFIKGKATKRFSLENGKINEKAPWYSLFYAE